MEAQCNTTTTTERTTINTTTLFDHVINAILTLTGTIGPNRKEVSNFLVSRKLVNKEMADAQVSKALFKGLTEGLIGVQKNHKRFVALDKTHASLNNDQLQEIIDILVSRPDVMSMNTAEMAKQFYRRLKEGEYGVKMGCELPIPVQLERYDGFVKSLTPTLVEGSDIDQSDQIFDSLVFWKYLKPDNVQVAKEIYQIKRQDLRRATVEIELD